MCSLQPELTVLYCEPRGRVLLLRVDATADFKKAQTSFYKTLKTLVENHNFMSAIYRTLSHMLRKCERVENEFSALRPSKNVDIQHAQAGKAQIKQDMFEVNGLLRRSWSTLLALIEASK